MIGRTVGKYRIVGQLGRGGAGVVYKAVDETLHRDVAIKTLSPDLSNPEVMARFRAEATILARLSHPQIATIFELFRNESDLLMVMEFVRGETLDKFSERMGPLPPDRAAYLIDLVLSALEHAHRAGVVHRDVKPANVMVTDEGGVKIMDFGIARVLGADHKTVDFRLMGTPAYMSPEQVLGEEVDGRSDLYSVGVLFYRLLTGALPFAADTALGMLQRQIRDTPLPVDAHQLDLPDWCGRIVDRALAKAPADRFQSAEEFRDALAQATGSLQTGELAKIFTALTKDAAPPAAAARTVDLSRHDAEVDPPTAGPAPASPFRPSRFRWVHAAAAVLLVALVAVNYLVMRETSTEAAAVELLPAVNEAPVQAPVPEPVSLTPSGVETSAVADIAAVSAPPNARPVDEDKPVVETKPAVQASRLTEPKPGVETAPVELSAPASRRTTPVATRISREPSPTVASSSPPPPPEPVAPSPSPVAPVERPVVVPPAEPALVFETRAFVGTRKPREQSAQLVLGEGKITIIPQGDPTTPLCSFVYGRVISISVSRSRDPLWNSPEGPAPVVRAGGTLSRLGIQVSRDWITLRTGTEEQFIAMRFDEVLLKRVLLALEERTGRAPQFLELPKN